MRGLSRFLRLRVREVGRWRMRGLESEVSNGCDLATRLELALEMYIFDQLAEGGRKHITRYRT